MPSTATRLLLHSNRNMIPEQRLQQVKRKELQTTIIQLAIRILFPLAMTLMLASVLPIAFQAVVLTASAIGFTFLSGFFFQPESFYCPPTPPRASASLPSKIPSSSRNLREWHPATNAPVSPNDPRGYVNVGNNCWLNADLQLCESDPGIREWFRNPLPQPEQPLPPAEAQDYQDFIRAHQVFRHFFRAHDRAVQENRGVSTGYSSQNVRIAISKINAMIEANAMAALNRQEDAHEGISPILEKLPDNLKIHFETKIHYNTNHVPAIAELPTGIRVREERPWCIELAITGNSPNIPDMLGSHCNEIIRNEPGVVFRGVDGNERRYQHTRIERRFLEAPPMLRFTLKRFFYQKAPVSWLTKIPFLMKLFPQLIGKTMKNSCSVRIPEHLSIPIENGANQNYRLKAFNSHEGTSPNSGHYTAYSRRGDQWYWENDSFVTPVAQPRVQQALASPNPYMIWYERV